MRLSVLTLLLVAVLVPAALLSQAVMPRMTTVEPGNGKVGDVITVSGENLDKANVAEVYLTDGKDDIKVAITDQIATAIKFKIPEKAKAGRLALMLLTKGKEPKLIEQPVKVTIE